MAVGVESRHRVAGRGEEMEARVSAVKRERALMAAEPEARAGNCSRAKGAFCGSAPKTSCGEAGGQVRRRRHPGPCVPGGWGADHRGRPRLQQPRDPAPGCPRCLKTLGPVIPTRST